MGRVLAVDLGFRRVGLALSDPGRMLASPLETRAFKGLRRLTSGLTALCQERGADLVVVGYPANESRRAQPVAEAAAQLKVSLEAAGIQTTLWDESFTSREAQESLARLGISRRRDPGAVDRAAATLLLRSYLEADTPPQASRSTD